MNEGPHHEATEMGRLEDLRRYEIMDTAPEPALDRLTQLAAELFDVPIALISLIDEDRQWFKSRVGLDCSETPREWAFCAHAIQLDPGGVLVVEDARKDARFAANPLVTDGPLIRFYAGAVLTSPAGENLGTLCIIDTRPRPTPSPAELKRLQMLAAMVVDELELRRANQGLKAKQQLLELAETIAEVGHWRLDFRTEVIEWSDEVYRIHGVDRETFVPDYETAVSFYPPEQRAELDALVARSLATGRGYDFEFQLHRRDGAMRDVVCKAQCEVDDSGAVSAIFGVFQDVTAHRRAMREVQENARRLEMAEAVAGLGHWRLDIRDSTVTWSPQMYRIYGLDPAVTPQLDDLLAMGHPDDAEGSRERIKAALAGELGAEARVTRIHRADGELRYLTSRTAPEHDAAGALIAIIGTVMDVTAQKKSEIELETTEARYRLLAENARDMILKCDLDGRVIYISPSVTQNTGYTAAEILGRPVASFIHPDDLPAVAAAAQAQIDSRGAVGPRPVEYRILCKDGRHTWFEASPTLAFDRSRGQMRAFTDVIRDISARKTLESELRTARAEAEAAAAVKAEFMANMSHELRTPLTSIIGFTGLAGRQQDLSDTTRHFIERVGHASRALLCTVNDILDFSKLEAGQVSVKPEITDPLALCRATLDLVTPQAGGKDLELKFHADIPEGLQVSIDPDRVRQILLNLLSNAVKFTPAGSVTLVASYDTLGARLRMEVIDTGRGIPQDQQDRLFKRFSQIDGSSTRSAGGTGLGLAICKGLVEAMGGSIGVTSSELGSRFFFELPADNVAAANVEPGAAAPENIDLTGFRVLVVDDHGANRALARLYLSAVGAEILEAEDGEGAVATAAKSACDAILMDLRMPGLDGVGASARIRANGGPNARTPILAFTADASDQERVRLLSVGFQGMVAKPLDVRLLLSEVANAVTLNEGAS